MEDQVWEPVKEVLNDIKLSKNIFKYYKNF